MIKEIFYEWIRFCAMTFIDRERFRDGWHNKEKRFIRKSFLDWRVEGK